MTTAKQRKEAIDRLMDGEGLTAQQTADRLGLKLGYVTRRRRRAREQAAKPVPDCIGRGCGKCLACLARSYDGPRAQPHVRRRDEVVLPPHVVRSRAEKIRRENGTKVQRPPHIEPPQPAVREYSLRDVFAAQDKTDL